MFAKDKVSQSMIDAVNGVISLDEKVTKKRSTDTLAGRVAIPATSGDNEHTSYKVDLSGDGSKSVEEEVELDEVLDTFGGIKSYLDKSAAKRQSLSATGKLGDDSHRKISKSFAGSGKAIDKWNKKNNTLSTESYDDEDPDVARADRELKRMGAKPIRASRKTDPEKEMSKLSKKAPKEGGDDLDQDHEHKEEYMYDAELTEMINIKSTSMGDVVKDFQTSDAPQFAGKSQAKRRQMAVAAKMAAEEYFVESSLEDRVDEIKKSAKTHFKKIKTNEGTEKPSTPHYTDPAGNKRTQKNDPFYPEYDKQKQGKPSKEKLARLGLKSEEYLDEENAVDKVTMDIPLLIRIMEYSKEDAKSDMDLHKVAEKLTELSASGKTLSMDCYSEIVGGINEDTSKNVRMAIGIANDKRYKGGNMTGAVSAIEKLHKGLSNHPKVSAALQLANEEVELDEGERSDRKKSTLSVLDRIYKKASENTKLQKNRDIKKSKSKESGE